MKHTELIDHICLRDDLSTHDPYDVWKTVLGFKSKAFYNRHPLLALPVVGPITLFDLYLNNKPRLFYKKQEYPIVRALAALSLLNLYKSENDNRYLDVIQTHLQWLVEHSCQGYSGPCWGLSFTYAVGRDFSYGENTPLTTMTPYALEAFVGYQQASGDTRYSAVIEAIAAFFLDDIKIMLETGEELATSYAPFRDRIVTNAVSYTMYSYALLLQFVSKSNQAELLRRIGKMHTFIVSQQDSDGSWLYSPEGHSFIDCFHSCFIVKNMEKTRRILNLSGGENAIEHGYAFIKRTFLDSASGLYRRFSLQNKPSLIRFDLYDNAEMLNLSLLLDDPETAENLLPAIRRHFCKREDIYSQIVLPGIMANRNTLRWAIMPYIYALSHHIQKETV